MKWEIFGPAEDARKKTCLMSSVLAASRGWCYGKTPMRALSDSVPLAKEKILTA
jgi:hypothetical protein